MDIKPDTETALRRLRMDADLAEDLAAAIDEAHAEAVAYLDGRLYADLAELIAAQDVRGIVCTPDIIAAQLLLADVLVGNNSTQDRESKHAAALTILRRHRNQGV